MQPLKLEGSAVPSAPGTWMHLEHISGHALHRALRASPNLGELEMFMAASEPSSEFVLP